MRRNESQNRRARGLQTYETVRTRNGVRLVQHGTVLSEVLGQPGPTHSVADAIAAATQAAGSGSRIALLGFAGGGMLAPLRAMGGQQTVDAVDLDESGWPLFRLWCSAWAGAVNFDCMEACAWLRGRNFRYDVIIDDLSMPTNGDVFKPSVTWNELPPLIYRRIQAGGVAIFNLLRPTDDTWENGIGRVLRPGWGVRVIHFAHYTNRLVIIGRRLPGARELSCRMRASLRSIRSRLASGISVRTRGSPSAFGRRA